MHFKKSPPLERLACFYMRITGNFEQFTYFNFETNFLKNVNLFQKMEYSFLIESTKIENVTFPYKTALPEATVQKNRMGCTKWTHHKERGFP